MYLIQACSYSRPTVSPVGERKNQKKRNIRRLMVYISRIMDRKRPWTHWAQICLAVDVRDVITVIFCQIWWRSV